MTLKPPLNETLKTSKYMFLIKGETCFLKKVYIFHRMFNMQYIKKYDPTKRTIFVLRVKTYLVEANPLIPDMKIERCRTLSAQRKNIFKHFILLRLTKYRKLRDLLVHSLIRLRHLRRPCLNAN